MILTNLKRINYIKDHPYRVEFVIKKMNGGDCAPNRPLKDF